MADSSIDLLDLNREILLNPKAAGSNQLVALLELEKPGLEFLCPLAKAIFLLESNRHAQVNASEALASCLLVDYTFSGFPGADDHATVTEQVDHTINTIFFGQEIVLGFESTGEMTHYTSYWSDYARQAWAHGWPLVLMTQPQGFIDVLFNLLDNTAREKKPGAYPTDKGEFLGSLSYTLKTINDINVDGPEYAYSNGDDSWEGLSEQYIQRFPGTRNDRNGQMCWLHYLSDEQAENLGIRAYGDAAIGVNADYPAWVSKSVSPKDLEATWISPDDLQESYSQGKIAFEKSTDAFFVLGCGADWTPAQHTEDDDQIVEEPEGLIFDPLTPPLIEVQIQRGARVLPVELFNLAPYLISIGEMLD